MTTQPTSILGLETSCDETSAAVVVDGRDVRANVVSSQVKLHARYGGIVPEIASRAHVEQIAPILEQALEQAGCRYDALDAIAVTAGPGLVGSLLIGVTAAKTLSLLYNLPLVAVDHIEAHATSAALLTDSPPWPAVALVVSGGHTSLYLVRDFLDVTLLGQTVDDAAGEAFDKVAALLELGYPGGPVIERAAQPGNPSAIRFPRPWIHEPHFNFSFSGLKTAVLYHVYGPGRKYGSVAHLSAGELADIAASFQAALVETLIAKTVSAAQHVGVKNVVVGGGVAANGALRRGLAASCADAGITLHLTPAEYCTDNAAMVAATGYRRLLAGDLTDLWLEPRAGLRRPHR
ncbi:MAG: tRNA (adenosine(37)-N6)-threonylcarbamoyltransferase complex transferase subunit TsaD [Phycisphaerae bacterium]|jgi:N6-L-threonylcarbamoyladenine synthase